MGRRSPMRSNALLCLLLLPVLAFARLGETEAQCIERYGPADPTIEQEGTLFFHKSGFIVSTHFFEGKVDCIIYSKEKAGGAYYSEKFSDTELAELLRINGAEAVWILSRSSTARDKRWFSKEGTLIAYYRENRDPSFLIMTKDFAERDLQQSKKQEMERIQGL